MEISSVAPVATPDTSVPGWAVESGVDVGPETALVQSVARPPLAHAEAPKGADAALPRATHDLSEFALPSAQLTPAMLIGLQVEAAAGWPLFHPGGAPAPRPPVPDERDSDDRRGRRTHDDADDAPPAPPHVEARDTPLPAATTLVDETPPDDWCATLTRSLREALAARVPPHALLAAAEQWHRGRCVVLACPQGIDPAGPAWAFVLWPQPSTAAHPRAPIALKGLRVESRLQWSAPPHDGQWCHVRVVKEHHPRRGRQLIACDSNAGEAATHVACEVQLGPVLARSVRWCDVCVRINAVQRFWNALGAQWSVHVVVCAQPLAGVRALPQEDASW
jgi:hypothetical protein